MMEAEEVIKEKEEEIMRPFCKNRLN